MLADIIWLGAILFMGKFAFWPLLLALLTLSCIWLGLTPATVFSVAIACLFIFTSS